LRHIALNFLKVPGRVRLQSLTLASKLIAIGTNSKVPPDVLKIGECDQEFDVGDRAEFLLALVQNEAEEIQTNLKELLFSTRNPPQWTADTGCSEFQIGTFIHDFNHAVGDYEPLPDWAAESDIPDEAVRQQVRKDPEGQVLSAISGDADQNIDINDWLRGPDERREEEDQTYYSGYYTDEEEEEDRKEGLTFFD
jgi:hypothetical protein